MRYIPQEQRDAHAARIRAELAAFNPPPASLSDHVNHVPVWFVVCVGTLLAMVSIAAAFVL